MHARENENEIQEFEYEFDDEPDLDILVIKWTKCDISVMIRTLARASAGVVLFT